MSSRQQWYTWGRGGAPIGGAGGILGQQGIPGAPHVSFSSIRPDFPVLIKWPLQTLMTSVRISLLYLHICTHGTHWLPSCAHRWWLGGKCSVCFSECIVQGEVAGYISAKGSYYHSRDYLISIPGSHLCYASAIINVSCLDLNTHLAGLLSGCLKYN